MKRYLCLSLLLVCSLSFALTPVTIDSASINYTTHTLTVVGSGFCTGALPAVTFNTTRLKMTSACSSSVVVASLPVQAAGSYRLIIANSGGASATSYVTYGAVGPQGAIGPIGAKGATGLTGATGLQGVKGATGLTGASGAQGIAGPQGLTGATGATGAAGSTGATGSQGPVGLTGTTGAAGATGSTGPQGAAGPQGMPGPMGAQGLQGLAGPAGAIGPQGVAGINGNDGAAGPQGPQGLVGPQGVPGAQGTPSMPSGTWNYIASMLTTVNAAHIAAAGGVLNGQFLVTNGAQSNETESYNPTTNQWTVLAPSPTKSAYAVGAVINGQFYMVGGCSYDGDCRVNVTGIMQIYNPTTNTWSAGPSMPTASYDAASAVINGKLYVVGGDIGCPPCTNVPTLEIYDPVASTWTTGAPMPNALIGARGAAVGGKLYVVGGAYGSWPTPTSSFASNVSIYDPISNTWTQSASSIPVPVWGSSAVVMDGLVYVIGGIGTSQTSVTAVQVYNPAADTWTSLTPLDTARDSGVASVISGVIYLAGGEEPGSIYPTTAESFFQYPQGPAGPIGPIGATGPQGPSGLSVTGPQGSAGPTGPTGAAGPQGPQGPTGATGAIGPAGVAGTNGTGFNFRGTFDPNASYAVNDVATFAYTGNNITYNVNLTFGSGSAVGTITTDGTIGVLTPSNIVNWNLTLNDGTKTGVLTPSNTTVSGSGLSATSTNLLFDYSTWGTQFGFSSSAGVLCLTDYTNCFPGGTGLGTWSVGGDNLYSFASASGVQPIATGGTAANHGTSTYVATAPVTAGTATPGTSPWVMMAQAGTPGTPGINGTNGINGAPGINGINGLPGAQGIQGIPGTNGTNTPTNIYVNTTFTNAQVSGSAGIQSPGVIQLTNIPAGSYLVTGNITVAYGVDPQGHRFVNPWCDIYASDGGGSPMNIGQPAFATMELPFTSDGQTTTSTTLVVNGWVTLTNATNLIYVGCSINGPWDTTTLNTQVQTLTAVQSTVVKSAGSAY